MLRLIFPSIIFRPAGVFLLALGIFSVSEGMAQTVTYDIRASTRDKVQAITGGAKQGSFGSPSINDKGSVAYACILSGTNIDALTSYSIVSRKKGKKKKAVLAIQSGTPKGFNSPTGLEQDPLYVPILIYSDPRTLNDDFLINVQANANVQAVPWTGRMYRISKDVVINNKERIAFSGQFIETIETVTRDMGAITNTTYRTESYATIGQAVPSGKTYTNTCIITYLNYFAEILTRTTSMNQQNAVPYNGNFRITTDELVPGFAYYSPTIGGALVATVTSNAIGLPYFTTFDAFTDAIISANNVCFVVANLSATGAAYDGIWQGNNPNLQPVVTINTKAPGGGMFSAFDGKVGPSPNGKYAAFIANVGGGKVTRGVFRSTKKGEEIVTIAGIGDKAPGGGVFSVFTLASTNNRGQVAFLGNAQTTAGVTTEGIWLCDNKGANLRLIVVTGQSIQVGKKLKQVTNIAFSPISGLNRSGQIAFTASFNDRTSSVIVAK